MMLLRTKQMLLTAIVEMFVPIVGQATSDSCSTANWDVNLLDGGPRALTADDCLNVDDLLDNRAPTATWQENCSVCGGTGQCGLWEYVVDGSKSGVQPDHTTHTINAGVALLAVSNSSTSCAAFAAGDSKTDYLEFAFHESPCRFNANALVTSQLMVTGASSPIDGTVLITKGRQQQSCGIPGIGAAVNTLLAINQESMEQAGDCSVKVFRNPAGKAVDYVLDPAPAVGNVNEGCELVRAPIGQFALKLPPSFSAEDETFRAAADIQPFTTGEGTCFWFTTDDGELVGIGKPCPDKKK
jgi:hypothetical protein